MAGQCGCLLASIHLWWHMLNNCSALMLHVRLHNPESTCTTLDSSGWPDFQSTPASTICAAKPFGWCRGQSESPAEAHCCTQQASEHHDFLTLQPARQSFPAAGPHCVRGQFRAHLLNLHVVGHVAAVGHAALQVARPRKLRQGRRTGRTAQGEGCDQHARCKWLGDNLSSTAPACHLCINLSLQASHVSPTWRERRAIRVSVSGRPSSASGRCSKKP